jgi:manganese/zinc/iron transport system permease protein
MDWLFGWLGDYTLRTVALGSATLGVVSGVLGSFAVLRRQSLLGDAISHAALPGLAIAFLLTRSKTTLVLVVGAAVAGWLGALGVMAVVRTTRIKQDAALGIVLSVFFGFGLVLLTYIQRLPDATQAGLDKFLFGQAAALVESDVVVMAGLGSVALAAVAILWKELKLLSFDPDFARSIGLPTGALDIALTTLIVVAIVIGLETVGVVLMSALVVAPAAAARQWSRHLGTMVLLAAGFGAASGVMGALISSSTARLPTGPTVVLVAGAFVAISLALAPERGLVARALRDRRVRKRLRIEVVLADLYVLSTQHDDPFHAHEQGALESMSARGARVGDALKELAAASLVRRTSPGKWSLTDEGRNRARAVLRLGDREQEAQGVMGIEQGRK